MRNYYCPRVGCGHLLEKIRLDIDGFAVDVLVCLECCSTYKIPDDASRWGTPRGIRAYLERRRILPFYGKEDPDLIGASLCSDGGVV